MKNIKLKLVIISWLVIWGMDTHAAPSTNIYEDATYKELLNTKDIVNLELSPNNHHFLLTYAVPQVYKTEQGIRSQWQLITLVKNDYKSEKSHTVKFPEDKEIDFSTWIPNSQDISYLGEGDKYTSLWVTPHQEFKPKKVLELNHDIKRYWWSPDGKKLAIITPGSLPSDDFKTVYDADKGAAVTLYILEANEKGDFIEKESFPLTFKKELHLSWLPGNEKVVLGYKSKTDETAPISQLILLDLKTKEQKVLVQGEQMSLDTKVSPDGKWLAYITTNFPGKQKNPIPLYQMDASRTCLISLQDNQKRCLAPTPNENPELVGWKQDGKAIFVMDQEGTSDQIYKISLEKEKATKFTQEEQTIQFAQLNPMGDKIVYSSQNLKTPSEGYVTPVDQFLPEKVISFSTSQSTSPFSIEKVKWKSKDKKFDLEGIVIYPNASQKKSLVPLMTLLKDYDAPSTSVYLGNLDAYPISYLRLLRRGYALFIPTRRGENGYGVQFRQAIYKELGKGDFEDIMAGIDAVIEGKKVDPTQLVLWGWGYGGYLSAWALAQTDRFKTIIVGQGISNLISQVGTTIEPEFLEAIMGGPFWKDLKLWDERSPISYVKNMNTPTFLQYVDPGEVIPKSQGEELSFPLQTRGITVEMNTYVMSGDEMNKPHMALIGIQELEGWLERYLRTSSNMKIEK